jgi:amidophosphoribosyltransferase
MALQHRGQDAAGMTIFDGKKLRTKRGIGLVSEIFDEGDLKINGSVGIGHTRYPTHGKCRMCDVQPMVLGGYAAAHNGHIANYDEIRLQLEKEGCRFTSSVDSEVMLFLLHKNKNIEVVVKEMMRGLEGSYSVTAIANGELLVFRDPHAIRPLVWGENEEFICFASESVALDINNIPYRGEINGGELVMFSDGKMNRKQLVEEHPGHCMFEYVYFARPDSIIDGKSVYGVRGRLGEVLAEEAPIDADVIIPVPDTSRNAAATYAKILGLPCEEGLIKNRYIGRTFIMPHQKARVGAVRLKLNPIKEIINGKSIVLVDDSIVRGTTLKEIVGLVRAAGAKAVHLRITCPPIKAPCFYGVDMSTYGELIANKKTVEEIREYLKVDSLAYISLDGLKTAIGLPICTACLNGEYRTKYVAGLAKKVK